MRNPHVVQSKGGMDVSERAGDKAEAGKPEGGDEKQRIARRDSAYDVPAAKKPTAGPPSHYRESPKPGANVRRKRDICEELRELVNHDDSDEAFERFRADKDFQGAFKTDKERKASRSQTSWQVSKGNILHQLVAGSREWELDDISKVLARIFKKPKGGRGLKVLLEDDPGDGTPVFLALAAGTNCNPRFISALLKLDPLPSNLGKVLCKPSRHHNEPYCLHATLRSTTRSNFADIKKIIELMRRHKPKETGTKPVLPFEDKNRDGNTALHLAIRAAPVLRSTHGSNDAIEPQYFDVKEALELIEILIEAHPKTLEVKSQVPVDNRPSAGRRSVDRTPYQERIFQLTEQFKRDSATHSDPVLSGRQDGPESGRASPLIKNKQLSVRDYLFMDDFRRYVIKDPVASYISYYCIKHLPREVVMACLYRRGEELLTEFDLLGFPRTTISETYLRSLETHVRFEQTLKYVALPRLVYVPPTASTAPNPA